MTKKIMIKKDFDPKELEKIGYTFSPTEGGYISNDTATIVNIHRSPYKRQVAQLRANVNEEHAANVEKLKELHVLEEDVMEMS